MRGGLQRVFSLFVGLLFVAGAGALGGCSHSSPSAETAENSEINTPPSDYTREILAAMHAYLNDPTGIHDAEIAPPALKTVGGYPHYVVCLRFNARKRGTDYAGVKEIAAVFLVGRFDRFLDKAQEQCAGASFAPFPFLHPLRVARLRRLNIALLLAWSGLAVAAVIQQMEPGLSVKLALVVLAAYFVTAGLLPPHKPNAELKP